MRDEVKEKENSNSSKKNIVKFLVPIVVAIIIIIAIIAIVLTQKNQNSNTNKFNGNNTSTGTNNNQNNNQNNQKYYTPDELEKNIITSGAVTKKGKLVVFVINKNNVCVDMEIEVEFYDKNNTIVGSGKNSVNAVGKDSEIAVDIWDTPTSWDNYKIYVDLEQSRYESYLNKINITHSNNGKEIVAQITNNSNEIIERIEAVVVYYQDNVVVGYDDDMEFDIKSGRSANLNFGFPTDEKYNKIGFDTYKVFVNEAYSYNW